MIKFAPVEQLIPQRPPFVMVDACLAHSEEKTLSTFKILPDNILVAEGHFTAYGLIENMAQTAAIRSGLAAFQTDKPAPVGFIGTITDTEIFHLPLIGAELETTVVQTTQLLNIIVISAECRSGNRLLARAAMKIVLMDSNDSAG